MPGSKPRIAFVVDQKVKEAYDKIPLPLKRELKREVVDLILRYSQRVRIQGE